MTIHPYPRSSRPTACAGSARSPSWLMTGARWMSEDLQPAFDDDVDARPQGHNRERLYPLVPASPHQMASAGRVIPSARAWRLPYQAELGPNSW